MNKKLMMWSVIMLYAHIVCAADPTYADCQTCVDGESKRYLTQLKDCFLKCGSTTSSDIHYNGCETGVLCNISSGGCCDDNEETFKRDCYKWCLNPDQNSTNLESLLSSYDLTLPDCSTYSASCAQATCDTCDTTNDSFNTEATAYCAESDFLTSTDIGDCTKSILPFTQRTWCKNTFNCIDSSTIDPSTNGGDTTKKKCSLDYFTQAYSCISKLAAAKNNNPTNKLIQSADFVAKCLHIPATNFSTCESCDTKIKNLASSVSLLRNNYMRNTKLSTELTTVLIPAITEDVILPYAQCPKSSLALKEEKIKHKKERR